MSLGKLNIQDMYELSLIIYLAENVGLSLSYGLSLNGALFWAIYMSCFVENRMVSVERIKQFTVIPSEPAWEIKDRVPPPNWPVHGNIDLKDLQVIGLRLLFLYLFEKLYQTYFL